MATPTQTTTLSDVLGQAEASLNQYTTDAASLTTAQSKVTALSQTVSNDAQAVKASIATAASGTIGM